jgi:UDP-N-acetylglucosamine:LPS N-acetylglucosamine transferase
MKQKLKVLLINRKEQISSRNATIVNILESLKLEYEVEELWILNDSGKKFSINEVESNEFNYKFFEDYKTKSILKILKKENPDLLFVTNDYEYIVRAFVISAKFLQIPTVLSLQSGFNEYFEREIEIKNRINIILKRGRFILKKYTLLLKAYYETKHNFLKISKIFFQDMFKPFFYPELAGRYGCDLILVINQEMKDMLKNFKIKSQIIVTGDPLMDSIYDNISKYKKKERMELPQKIVFMTTSTVEHGFWTEKMWSETITQTILQIKKEFGNKTELVLKIHPRSERKKDYEKILNKINIQIPILQEENLLDVVNEADLVISYAESWGLWEVLFLKKPIIIVNLFNYKIEKMPFVKEGMAYELKKISELKKIIKKIYDDEKLDKVENLIEKYLFKFDNKSSERSVLAIMKLVENFKEKQYT